MSEPERFLTSANRQRLLRHLRRLQAEAAVACGHHRPAVLAQDDTDLALREVAIHTDVLNREAIEP